MAAHTEPSLTYAGYLHLDEVLRAQHPVAPDDEGRSVRAAEHFFIVTHQAFELWFLLHYDYHTSALSRSQYWDKLTDKLGRKYAKNDPTLFESLLPHLDQGIRNAEKRGPSDRSEARISASQRTGNPRSSRS